MVHWIYLSGIKTFGPTRYSRTSWYPLDLYAAGLHVDVVENGNNDLDENISPAGQGGSQGQHRVNSGRRQQAYQSLRVLTRLWTCALREH